MVEQGPHKALAVGSNPARTTNHSGETPLPYHPGNSGSLELLQGRCVDDGCLPAPDLELDRPTTGPTPGNKDVSTGG